VFESTLSGAIFHPPPRALYLELVLNFGFQVIGWGMEGKAYHSDISDDKWANVAPYLTLMTEEAPQPCTACERCSTAGACSCARGRRGG
jgi:hypothetical protein